MTRINQRKTGRNLLPYADIGTDWRDGWQPLNGISGGFYRRETTSGRTYFDILQNTLVSARFTMPINAKALTAPGLGYRLDLYYQPTTRPGQPEPNAQLFCYPSARFSSLILPTPGDGSQARAAPWLTLDTTFGPGAQDNELELRLASGRQPDGTSLAPAEDPDSAVPEDGPDWPSALGRVHICGEIPGSVGTPGMSVGLFHGPLSLNAAHSSVSLDGVAARWLIDGKIPVCKGAEHRLALSVDDACGWAGDTAAGNPGTLVYAYWRDEAAADEQKLTLTPTEATPDDDAQHVQSPWTLTCDATSGGVHEILIESVHHAPPFALPALLVGDFKLLIGAGVAPDYKPCVALQETAVVRAQVVSAITDMPAVDTPVQWRVDGASATETRTDGDGWATFEFRPTADANVTVSVEGPYNEVPDLESISVQTIASPPWEQFQFLVDGERVDSEYGRVLLFPETAAHKLTLKPQDANVSLGEMVSLDYAFHSASGASGSLTFSPAPGVQRELTKDGLEWTVVASGDAISQMFDIIFTCKPWKTPPVLSGTVVPEAFELVALPGSETSMQGDYFVLGPTDQTLAPTTHSIVVQARAISDGSPLPGVPCALTNLVPDTAISSNYMTLNIEHAQITDATGSTTFPATFHMHRKEFHDDARITIVGGPSPVTAGIRYRRPPSRSSLTCVIAHIFPGRPDLGIPYATPTLRVFVLAQRYATVDGQFPNIDPGDVDVVLDLHDGSTLGPYKAIIHQDAPYRTLSATLDILLPPGDYSRVVHARISAGGRMGGLWHFDVDTETVEHHPQATDGKPTRLIYAPVQEAPINEWIYLQWPTYTNKEPWEQYSIYRGTGAPLDIEIFPIEYGQTAMARVRSTRAERRPLTLIRGVKDSIVVQLCNVALTWT
ncbi:Ig-like domain-containing protein [Pandoraea oxalativorans]|uniref:Uncharacterized protein n=1 Tax=Pandoraea oxalativorans TaxID=573737 RepID=A0A0E3U7F0_9BURK|nr:Ig-like domain-containing protein [Pandoraea oxalativorans]AKC70809.1 hypothetical protein MB84_16970 [Pandoraea oxalativorans]